MSLFADNMILYIENSKDTTRKLVWLINELVNLQDTKLIHRNLLHSCIVAMKNQKEGFGKPSHLPSHQIEMPLFLEVPVLPLISDFHHITELL